MSNFPVLDAQTAPEASKAVLAKTQKGYGFVPNLYGVLAQSPAAVEAYSAIAAAYEKTDLNPVERQVVLLTISAENACHYCVAAHSTVAQMVKAPPEIVDALRQEKPLPDAKLDALRTFTLAVVKNRGWVDPAQLDAFYAAGYQPRHVLDVLTGLSLKTLSNYTNHIVETPLDEPFKPNAWSRTESAA